MASDTGKSLGTSDKISEHLVHNLIAGSLSRFVAVAALHPLDVVKTRLQYQREQTTSAPSQHYKTVYTSGTHVFTSVLRDEGPRALYKGLGVRLAYILPAAGVNFTIYEQFKAALKKNDWTNWRLPASLIVGGLARAFMTFIRTPFDIVKQEIQVQGMHSDVSVEKKHEGVRGIITGIKESRGNRGFFAGFHVTLARDIVFSSAYFGSYELQKMALRKYIFNKKDRYLALQDMISGGGAGVIATLCSLPIDVMKTRLQTQLMLPQELRRSLMPPFPRYSGIVECVKVTLAEEGSRAFFRGLYPRLMQTIPSGGLTFMAYEQIKRLLALIEE